jgi:hypothetical protein
MAAIDYAALGNASRSSSGSAFCEQRYVRRNGDREIKAKLFLRHRTMSLIRSGAEKEEGK